MLRRSLCLLPIILICASTHCRAEHSSVTLAFTGDIMMHYAVKGCALQHDPEKKGKYTTEGFSYLFEKVAPVLSSADFTVGNMEFPVSPPFIQNEFIFNCPPQVIPALRLSGFKAVSLANNHLLDQKNKGVIDTFVFLENEQIPYFGAARTEKKSREGLLLEKNGIRIRVLSYTGLLNYAYPANNNLFYINRLDDKAALMADIAAARKDCDILIIQPHTGVEYTLAPVEEQRSLYREMINAGADLVIGHHPHVLQYAEGVTGSDGRQCAIFYSLGNFICNQNYTFPVAGTKVRLDIRDSIIVVVTINKDGGKAKWSARVLPTNTIHEMRPLKKGSYKDIQTVLLREKIEALTAKLPEKGKERAAMEKLIAYYKLKVDTIRKVLFRKGDVPGVTFDDGQ